MQRFAHQTFLSACVHAQADAPEGRRSVATGGASPAAKRAERNPWTHSHLNHPAPEGRRELHGADKTPRSIFTTCSAYLSACVRARADGALVNATRESFAPPGRKGDDEPVFHGFRPPPADSTRGYNPSPLWGESE